MLEPRRRAAQQLHQVLWGRGSALPAPRAPGPRHGAVGTCSSQPETLPCSYSRGPERDVPTVLSTSSWRARERCRHPRDVLVNGVGWPARGAASCALPPPALSDSSLVAVSVGSGLAAFGTADFSGPQRIQPFVFWEKKLLWSRGALWNGVRNEAFL